MARTIGIILIVLGALGIVVDNLTYTETETVVNVGDIELEAENRESVRIAPVVAGGAVIVGLGFLLVGVRRDNDGT